jgi:hypothetical protein
MRVKDVQLAQLKGKTASASPPLDGVLQARLVLRLKGNRPPGTKQDPQAQVRVVHLDCDGGIAEPFDRIEAELKK